MARQPRSQRLQIVLKLARQKEEAAQKELARAQERLQAEQAKLEQLRQFQAEYQANLQSRTGTAVNPMQYRALSAFISRLSVAMQEQERQIQLAAVQVERARQQWLLVHQRHQNMDRLIERYRDEEIREQDRREQRQADEAALRNILMRGRDS